MFDVRLKIVLLVMTICSMLLIIRTSKKSKMEVRDAANWFFVSLALVFSAIFPEVFIYLSRLIGIELPSNAVFSLLLFLLFCIVYYLNIRISQLSIRLRETVQTLSLMEKAMRDVGLHRLQLPTEEGNTFSKDISVGG
jgi:hypothetical protein